MLTGQYIKLLRENRGISQEELGKFIGVQKAAVQKWESGKVQNLKRETIKKLAEYFCVPASNFIDSDSDSESSSILASLSEEDLAFIKKYSLSSKEDKEFIRYLFSATEEEQEMFYNIIKAVKKERV